MLTRPTPARPHDVRAGVAWGDPAWVLALYTALVLALPAKLTFAALGPLGRPGLLVGLGAAWLCVATALDRRDTMRRVDGHNPICWLIGGYAAYHVVGYVIGHTRVMTPLEVTSADRALLALASSTGVALLTASYVRSRDRLHTVISAVIAAATLSALVGIYQFATGFDPVSVVKIPGFRNAAEYASVSVRSLFHRPRGIALHPIEFGVVTALVLPLAIHRMLHAPSTRSRHVAALTAIVLAFAIPMSVSRSAILALGAALIVYQAGWSWRRRANAAVVGLVFLLVVTMLVPGLLGTIKSLFKNAETDPSIVSRRERQPLVTELVAERPWFGRGYGTYTPEDYFLLDNQYYETAIESGMVGVGVTVGLFTGAVATARRVRRRATDEETRDLAQALCAIIAGIAVATYTFDAFFYPAFTGVLFLTIGIIGALWRLGQEPEASDG